MKNKYAVLQKRVNDAQRELHEYRKTCIEVKVNGPSFNDIRNLHNYLKNNFEYLISDSLCNYYAVDYLTLIAPKDEILSALELTLESLTFQLTTVTELLESLIKRIKEDSKDLSLDYRY